MPTEWICHAFHEDLNECMRLVALEAIDFLSTHYGLTREEAYSLLSVAADFRITQVIDENKGIHVVLRKDWFRAPATWPQPR